MQMEGVDILPEENITELTREKEGIENHLTKTATELKKVEKNTSKRISVSKNIALCLLF